MITDNGTSAKKCKIGFIRKQKLQNKKANKVDMKKQNSRNRDLGKEQTKNGKRKIEITSREREGE